MARRKRKLKRGVRVNRKKTKISGKERILKQTIQYPCGVCMKGVRGNSVLCSGCQKWCHKKCSGLENLNDAAGEDFKCPTCVNTEHGVRYPCGTCGKGVGANSVLCTVCQKWCHKRCSRLKNLREAGNKFRCPSCVKDQEGGKLEEVESFCYLIEKFKCKQEAETGTGTDTGTCKYNVLGQPEVHKENVETLGKGTDCFSDIFESVTNSKIKENGKESCKNKVIEEFPLIKKDSYVGAVFDTQKNTESLLLTIGQICINEDEKNEVPRTSKEDDGEKYFSTGMNVTKTTGMNVPKNIMSESPQSSSCVDVEYTLQNFISSTPKLRISEKVVGDIIEDKPQNSEYAPQFQNLIAQAVHKEHVIIPSFLCNLKDQSQIKEDVSAPSSTSEDTNKQNLSKFDSKDNLIDKKHSKNMNDSIKDKMSKTDKKNEKLKVGENYDRINYLVQASRKVFKNDKSVSSQLGALAISFGRRLPQVRLDPLLKREMCKGCGIYLVYGVNAKVRHRSKRQKHLVVTCMTCRTIKRFVTNPKHKLWSEQPEAQVN